MSTGEEAVSLCNTSKLFLNNIAESESMQLKKASETSNPNAYSYLWLESAILEDS